ncbi:tRNA1(Val) (adenine(37)-N6)-methyltransferase [Loigolactobacillus jiayinensis]|uniref:tRNA1(Val) (Adenine(37)-N6)-methyltransferase n=1 Tax=Loigolactobacillus jiayinensis TaxID=2486016 RepID=A0ABW1REE2_9LACO|nr:tRNA1(Val) (adenine(37)-N6)-methyltransferase [Loigolactobacillus jiayinensis]
MLKADERIDQLYSQTIQIIQSPSVFSFSLDAVLLADFAVIKAHSKTVDLCAGNGAVSLFLSGKTTGPIAAIELQPRLADMAQRSVALNQLTAQISVYQMDLKDTFTKIAKDSVDVVTCNPPYFPPLATSKKNPNPYLAIARHEIATSLEEILKITSGLLKMNGKAFFVYRPDRFNEFVTKAAAWRLETKRVRFIHPKADCEANMVLIELIKDGRPGGQRFLPPITVYDQNNHYLPEVRRLLYGSD